MYICVCVSTCVSVYTYIYIYIYCMYKYDHKDFSSESVRPRACFIGLLHHGHGIFHTAYMSRHHGAVSLPLGWTKLFNDLCLIVWRFGYMIDISYTIIFLEVGHPKSYGLSLNDNYLQTDPLITQIPSHYLKSTM